MEDLLPKIIEYFLLLVFLSDNFKSALSELNSTLYILTESRHGCIKLRSLLQPLLFAIPRSIHHQTHLSSFPITTSRAHLARNQIQTIQVHSSPSTRRLPLSPSAQSLLSHLPTLLCDRKTEIFVSFFSVEKKEAQ